MVKKNLIEEFKDTEAKAIEQVPDKDLEHLNWIDAFDSISARSSDSENDRTINMMKYKFFRENY